MRRRRARQIAEIGQQTGNMLRYKKTVYKLLWISLLMVSFYAPFSYVTAVRLIKGPCATDAIPFSPFVTVRVIIGPEATKAVTVRLVPVKTGVFLNFFLNPCVYIWEHREERRAVIDKLRAFLSFLPLAVTNDNRNCSPF